MNRTTTTLTLSLTLASALALTGCSDSGSGQGPLDGVDSIVFLQRPARGAVGDIFQYDFYQPGARIVKLSPPTADGELTVVCCEQDPAFAEADISGYDLSFDAREIVFSAKLSSNEKYGLYILSIETGNITPIPTNPNHDYVQPVFVPGDRIFFTTNAVVEEGTPQHRDEYERRETSQVGVINRDGSNETLGARNLSHRTFPSLLSDGRVVITHWDHLGEMNSGHLVIMNPDMTRVREAFGKQDTGITNSYYKAVEVSPGRLIAIGSSRDRTVQAGTILDIRLGEVYQQDGKVLADRNMAEANASYRILTPQVPREDEPSFPGVGRYFNAYPLNARDYPDLLVSWANGPVEDASLDAAGVPADFGIYLYESKGGLRRPIYNDEEYWDVFPRPLAPREAPPVIPASATNDFSQNAVLIGSTDVYQSSLDSFDKEKREIYGVRVLEGFSSEEGLPRDFGLTEHEGSARLGVAEVHDDGSWAALIPANIPVHVQVIDKFGMALRSEPVWISGRKGESLLCNGCHEDRARAAVIQPGLTEALADGPVNLMSDVARADRKSTDFSINGVVGVPWDLALQPIFDAKCVSCHDGTASDANPSYTITDPETGESFSWTFDLRSTPVEYSLGEELISGYSASHLSLMGPYLLMLQPEELVIDGEVKTYVTPSSARESELIKKLNPPQLYPTPDTRPEAPRAFPDITPHAQEQGFTDLTPDEYHLLILMVDGGGQFYSRENPPANPAP